MSNHFLLIKFSFFKIFYNNLILFSIVFIFSLFYTLTSKKQNINYILKTNETSHFNFFNEITTMLDRCINIYEWPMNFHKPATQIMYNIINFHHDLMYYIIIIAVIVLYFLI